MPLDYSGHGMTCRGRIADYASAGEDVMLKQWRAYLLHHFTSGFAQRLIAFVLGFLAGAVVCMTL